MEMSRTTDMSDTPQQPSESTSSAKACSLDGMVSHAPVRLCCGQRHFGVVCPDGRVMCCLCFERCEQGELNVASDGQKENVCKKCAEEERMANV